MENKNTMTNYASVNSMVLVAIVRLSTQVEILRWIVKYREIKSTNHPHPLLFFYSASQKRLLMVPELPFPLFPAKALH